MKLLPTDLPRRLHVYSDRRVKRPRATIVLLHGIGNTGGYWRALEQYIPDDVRVVSIDLLGFGKSPKPLKATYNVRVQARSIAVTLLTLRTGRIYIVGHSMGALIAIELAKRYPLLVRGLVLCSPPIYKTESERKKTLVSVEAMLKDLYVKFGDKARANPDRYIALANAAAAARVTPSTFQLTDETITPYIAALKSSIVDQSSYTDVLRIGIPVHIIYGRLDPFIITKNLKKLAKQSESITLHSVLAGHETTRAFKKPIIEALQWLLSDKT